MIDGQFKAGGKPRVCLLLLVHLLLSGLCGGEDPDMFPRDVMRAALVLNGEWQALQEHGAEQLWDPAVAARSGPWKKVAVPGDLQLGIPRDEVSATRNAWVRRSFDLTVEQAARDSVLKWGMIRHGAKAWINGRLVGEHLLLGPATLAVPPQALRAGANEILLYVPAWGGIRKNAAGFPLFPTGGGTQSWGGKSAFIGDDVWLEFYDRAYLKNILAMPDLADQSVTFRLWPEGPQLPANGEITVVVTHQGEMQPAGQVTATRALKPAPLELRVPLNKVFPWTPDTRDLYSADFTLRQDGKILDHVRLRFGMRELKIVDGHYQLNGSKFRFYGTNLAFEWNHKIKSRADIEAYLIDEARTMHMNCFRTHTQPPPTLWANVADERGAMFFAEMGVLYNYADYQFSPADYAEWHANCIADMQGWVTKLWNHPSVVMWVSSNESKGDTEWEAGEYRQAIGALDPTRPVFRSGGESSRDEILDIHTCENMSWYSEGRFNQRVLELLAQRHNRPIGDSEYMNWLDGPDAVKSRLLGRADHPYAPYVRAEFCNEDTAFLRQHRFDLILPYQYANWSEVYKSGERQQPWRDDFYDPMTAALYSTLAPVIVTIDMKDRNYVAGQKLTLALKRINDLPAAVTGAIDLYLTPVNPLFVESPAAAQAAIWHTRLPAVEFPADAVTPHPVEITVPAAEGIYFVYAVLKRPGVAKPIVSQRVVRAIDPAKSLDGLKPHRLLVLGADAAAKAWLQTRKIDFDAALPAGDLQPETVPTLVIWDIANLTAADRAAADRLKKYLQAGGRVVVLNEFQAETKGESKRAKIWDWPELLAVNLQWDHSSRLHAYPEAKTNLLHNLHPEMLWRLNGLDARVGNFSIAPPYPDNLRKLFFIERPAMPVIGEYTIGRGRLLFSLAHLKPRLDQAAPTYDPAAERLMLNLLFPVQP